MINPLRVKVHFTHKWRIKQLFKEGFSVEELSLAYKVPTWYVESLTQALKRPERI
jgi:hypothetical protein